MITRMRSFMIDSTSKWNTSCFWILVGGRRHDHVARNIPCFWLYKSLLHIIVLPNVGSMIAADAPINQLQVDFGLLKRRPYGKALRGQEEGCMLVRSLAWEKDHQLVHLRFCEFICRRHAYLHCYRHLHLLASFRRILFASRMHEA